MTEIIFVVEQEPDGEYVAESVSHNIYTQGDDLEQLRAMVRDAVACTFPNEQERPKLIRLHFVHDEVIVA